jgi:hypothetical protein
MFNINSYTGNVAASNVNLQFQVVGNEFHLIMAPVLGAGLFQTFAFSDTITILAGVAPNIPPASYQITAAEAQAFFPGVAGSSGVLTIQNTPGPTFNLSPANQ